MNPNFSLNPIIDNAQNGQQSMQSTSAVSPAVQYGNVIPQMGGSQPTNTAPKDSSNWFTHLLPTIGSIAAPIIGGLATGGTGLLAGSALSAAGGAGGQALENLIEGKDPLQQNVVDSGVQNAFGGLAGGLLGKIGGKLLPKAASAFGNASDNLIMGQAVPGAVNKQLANTLRTQYGSTNLAKTAEGAQIATGQNTGIDKIVNSILQRGNDNGISTKISGYGRLGNKINSPEVNNAAVASGLGEGTKGAGVVQSYIDTLLQKYNPEAITSINGKAGNVVKGFDNGVLNTQSPLTIKKMTSDMGSTASTWMSSRDPTIIAQGKTLQTIRNNFNDLLSGPAGGNAMPVTMADKIAATQELAPLEATNKSLYQALVDKIHSPDVATVGDLRSIEAPLVRSNIAVNNTSQAIDKSGGLSLTDMLPMGGGAAGFGLGGIQGGVTGYLAGKALKSQPAQVAGAGILSQLSKVAGSDTAKKMLPILSKVGATTAVNIPTMGAGATQSTIDQPTLGGEMNNQQTGISQPGKQPAQTPYDQMVQAAIAQSILDPGNGNGEAFLSGIAPKLQARQTLQSMLPTLQTAYDTAGGAQGLGGIGSMASSLFPGTAANAYQSQQQAVAGQLANTLGISKEEALAMLPQLMQDSATSANRISGLNSIVGSLAGGR